MEPIMVDDSTTLSSASPAFYGLALAAEMSRISAFKMTRRNASKWVQTLNFLVYDDSDEEPERDTSSPQGLLGPKDKHEYQQEKTQDDRQEQKRKDLLVTNLSSASQVLDNYPTVNNQEEFAKNIPSNTIMPGLSTDCECSLNDQDEQQMLDSAIALSLAEEGDDQNIMGIEPTSEPHQKDIGQRRADEAVEGSDERKIRSCDKCQHFQTFDLHEKPKTFSIVRNVECRHYLAVSYCWPKDETGNPKKHIPTYRVRTKDEHGEIVERKNRAPDEVIDRAVEFARSIGIRMIWLDQECLPQDNSNEQELAIQGMDMVYQRAYVSCGLFESVIHDQSYLNAAASVLHWGMNSEELKTKPPGLPPRKLARDLVSFLELLGDDPWNTRAWILQESVAASHRMVILLKTDPHMQFSAPSQVLEPCPITIPGTFNCIMSDLQRLVEISRRFLLSRNYTAWNEVGPPSLEQERAGNAVAKLQSMHPKAANYGSWLNNLHLEGGSNYGGRKTCNAAVALTFLRTRLNFRPADRLAILANLCDYEVRLSTVDLETKFQSLSTCLFTLAIINGDLSLLNPDAYQSLRTQAPISEMSWLPPYKSQFAFIDAYHLRPGLAISLRNSNRYQISKRGLTCPAYLWAVNRMADLTPIKLRYQGAWATVKCYDVSSLKGETIEDLRKRGDKIKRKIMRRNEQLRQGNIEGWSPDDDPTVVGKLYAERVENDKSIQDLIGNILVEILRHLHREGEISLANSIWQSIRVDAMLPLGRSDFDHSLSSSIELPDDVGDLILREDLIRNSWQLFQLEKDRHGLFHQIWLIDRIMRCGSIWVGNYIEYSEHCQYSKGKTKASPSSLIVQSESSQEGAKLPQDRQKNILLRQAMKQLSASAHRVVLDKDDDGGINVGALVCFSYILHYNVWSEEAEARRAERISVFDVDGACTIATPFDSELERLPHPGDRSMSVCWVIEHLQKEKEMQQKTDIANFPQDGEANIDRELTREQDKDIKNTEMDVAILDEDKEGCDVSESCGPVESGEYRIIGKVKGMWEIMDDPEQRYLFV